MSDLDDVLRELQSLQAITPDSDTLIVETMRRLVEGIINLCKWIQASMEGAPQPERFLNAAKAQATVAEESLGALGSTSFVAGIRKTVGLIKSVSQLEDVKPVVAELGRTSVPVPSLTEGKRQRGPTGLSATNVESKDSGPFVIKLMFEIAGQPWSNRQVLLSDTLYDVHAKITVLDWPKSTDYLLIDYISTLSPPRYSISTLRVDRPKSNVVKEFDCHAHAEFPVAQDLLSEPLVIRVRAAFFESSGVRTRAADHIVGYHQLRVRVSDKIQTPWLSGYKAIDARVVEIVDEIRRELTIVPQQHLADFVAALAAITNYAGISLQQALYREGMKVREADFQRDLLLHLRTLLGEDVQEGPRQAGGPTDIKYKSVTIELKVEKEISDRRKILEKYCSQPTQYSSGTGAQLGIVCILDLTEKHYPPANPQSQITLETPKVHGFPEGSVPFPTKIAAVIIDGNLRLPSSYSHRR